MQEEQQNTDIAEMQMEQKKQHEKTREKNKNENNVQLNTASTRDAENKKSIHDGKATWLGQGQRKTRLELRPHGGWH